MSDNASSNPYTPISGESLEMATEQRSPVPMVFAILNLLFGALGICGAFGFVIMLFVSPPAEPNPEFPIQMMPSEGPARYIQMAAMGVGMVLTFILIVSGIGLWQYKKWGRTLAIFYAVLTILATVLNMIGNLVFLTVPPMPANSPMDEGTIRTLTMAIVIGSGCAGLIYPVILLIFMQLQRVRFSLG